MQHNISQLLNKLMKTNYHVIKNPWTLDGKGRTLWALKILFVGSGPDSWGSY